MNARIAKVISNCQNQKPISKLKYDASVGISEVSPYTGSPEALSQEAGWQIESFDFPKIWTETKGAGVKVAVLDTGVDISHPDLVIKRSLNFVGIRNTTWWDSVNEKVIVPDIDYNVYTPTHNHGTHVSGIIGARDNNVGMIGVAPECDVYALRVLSESGSGYFSDMAIALLWCLYNENIDVVNMSLGGFYGDENFWLALKEVYDAGIAVIVSAGNEYYEADYRGYISFPAQYDESISVGAIDSVGDRAYFSSVGPNIDIMAPGVGILSSVIGGGYASYSGTCISGRCKVYTKRGPVLIKDVLVGDEVFSMNSDYKIKYSKCLNVISNGYRDVYKVIVGNQEVIATDNHPFLCLVKKECGGGDQRKRYSRCFEWKELKDIKVGDSIVIAKNIVCNEKEYSDDLCRFVGAYLGDGNLFFDQRRNSKEEYGFDLHIRYGMDKNSDLPGKYAQLIRNIFDVEVRNYDGSLRVFSKEIALKIKEIGLVGDVYHKRIPEWCFSSSFENKLHLIAGILDSDGTIKKEGYAQIELCNYDLIYDIKVLCEMVGLYTGKIRSRKRKMDIFSRGVNKEYESFMLSISGIDLFNIPIYDLEARERISKRSKTRKLTLNSTSKFYDFPKGSFNKDIDIKKIKSIVKLEEAEEVFDLTIEENHNFIVDKVIVHNSMAAPFITGLAALIIAKHRSLGGKTSIKNVEDLRRHLTGFATDSTAFEGRDIYTGWGIVEPNKSFAAVRKVAESPRVPFGRLYAGSIIGYNDRPWILK